MLVNLKEILKIAEEDKSAIGMFNATGFDSLQAVIGAAEELNKPVIIAHAEVHNVYNDISMVGPAMVAVAQNAKVPVCVHLDHGTSLDMVYKALRLGFTSVMMDASALPYEENLRLTKMITQAAHSMNVSVEAELGRLVTGEAGSGEEMTNAKAEDFYTRPDEAESFCKAGIRNLEKIKERAESIGKLSEDIAKRAGQIYETEKRNLQMAQTRKY